MSALTAEQVAAFESEVRDLIEERDEKIRAAERGRILALLDDAAVADRLAQACGDPGSIVFRHGVYESLGRWGSRAVIAELRAAIGGAA